MGRRSRLLIFSLFFLEILVRIFFRSRGVGVENLGVSFGLFSGLGGVWLGALVLLWLMALFFVGRLAVGWWLIILGGLLNLMDRLVFGGVWDYIHWSGLEFWNNGADIMIFIGAMNIIILNFKS